MLIPETKTERVEKHNCHHYLVQENWREKPTYTHHVRNKGFLPVNKRNVIESNNALPHIARDHIKLDNQNQQNLDEEVDLSTPVSASHQKLNNSNNFIHSTDTDEEIFLYNELPDIDKINWASWPLQRMRSNKYLCKIYYRKM